MALPSKGPRATNPVAYATREPIADFVLGPGAEGLWRRPSLANGGESQVHWSSGPSCDRPVPIDSSLAPRLLQLLDASSTKPLTVVISPAGTGKTSLLASWAATSNRPLAWLSVDEFDHDATQFWTGVIAALEVLVQGGLPRPLTLLQRPGAVDAAVAAVLDDLEEQQQPSSTLLIDDIHLVDDNPEAVDSLALFIQHLPRWLNVVLIARRAPRLPLARLRARGQLCEISYSDLLFSDEEAADLLMSLAPFLDEERVREIGHPSWRLGGRHSAGRTRRPLLEPQPSAGRAAGP